MNLLFICSRNEWRSRTAETILKNNQQHQIKSAGTESEARIRVTEKMVAWADLIFVMEKKHKQRLNDRFGPLLEEKEIITLDIPDEYQYMDPELVEMLKIAIQPYLQ